MKCADFQKMIPDIINNTVPDEKLDEVIEHIDNCKDCREELEIHYILRYGLEMTRTKKRRILSDNWRIIYPE